MCEFRMLELYSMSEVYSMKLCFDPCRLMWFHKRYINDVKPASEGCREALFGREDEQGSNLGNLTTKG
jgi:hypothetical protein